MSGLGPALKRLRMKRGWSKTDAAKRCQRISQPDLSRWEVQDRPNLRVDTLERLLDGYGATLMDLANEMAAEEPKGGDEPERLALATATLLEHIDQAAVQEMLRPIIREELQRERELRPAGQSDDLLGKGSRATEKN